MAVLAIDAGTSSCKAGVFSDKGMVAAAGREYAILSPKPGYAELDAAEVWGKIKDSVKDALAKAGKRAGPIRAVSFSSMGEAMVPVTMSRDIVGPCLMAYDCRGAEYAERLEKEIGQDAFYDINPNAIGPYFSMAKMLWIKDHLPDVYAKADKFLIFADFIGFMLGAEPYATNSLANRTLLLDIRKSDWSDPLLEWAGFPREKLGRVVHGGERVGVMSKELKEEFGLDGEILLVSGGHDQCCNALGCGCIKPGMAVAGLGTYETYTPCFSWPQDVRAYLDKVHNLEHHVLPDLFVSFLYNHSGLLVNWFRRVFAPNEQGVGGRSVYDLLNDEMPSEPTNILFLPHNEPLQWPVYDGETSGVFMGLKTATTRGDMFKALLEGITYYFVDVMATLDKMGMKPESFIASGGGSRSEAWLQIRADILDIPLTRLETGEGSLTGAAILAAMQAGMFASLEEAVGAYMKLGRVFTPDPRKREIYRESAALYKEMAADVKPLLRKIAKRG